MEFTKQPKPMLMEGDLGQNWIKFKSTIELYMCVIGCKTKDKEVQAAVILHCVGEEAREVFDTFELQTTQKKDSDVILKKFEEYFLPKKNVSVERHRCNIRIQAANENMDSFVADLRKIASNCDFGTLREELIEVRIVCEVLLREPTLDLKRAIEICKAAEETELHIKDLVDQTSSLKIETVNKTAKGTTRVPQRFEVQNTGAIKKNATARATKRVSSSRQRTKRGTNTSQFSTSMESTGALPKVNAEEVSCPVIGKNCTKCGKPNHFAPHCKSYVVNTIYDNNRTRADDREESEQAESRECTYNLGTVEISLLDSYEDDW